MGRWFKRSKKNRLTFDGAVTTVTKGVLAENRHWPVAEVKFVVKNRDVDGVTGEVVDEVVFHMDQEDAIKLYGQLGHTLSVIVPQLPRRAGSYQFGE